MEALDLRRNGAGYRLIASTLGVALGTAFHLVSSGIRRMEETCKEKAEEMRRIEYERLDRMHLSWWQKAIGGRSVINGVQTDIPPDPTATEKILAIMQRRA